MTVYVDDMRAPFRGMVMCHMIADSLEELHAMARRLGLRREWFQDTRAAPHYDLSETKRAAAIRLGARPITLRQCAMMAANRRALGTLGQPETALAVYLALRAAHRPTLPQPEEWH